MTTDDLAAKTYQPFSQAFFEALLKAISEASGSPWLAAAVPDAQPSADESELVRMNLVLAGRLARRVPAGVPSRRGGYAGSEMPAGTSRGIRNRTNRSRVECVQAGMGKFCSAHAEEYGTLPAVPRSPPGRRLTACMLLK